MPLRHQSIRASHPLSIWVDSFVDDLELRSRTPATISYYRRHLKQLIWFAQHERWPAEVAKLTQVHLRAYLRYLQTATERWESDHPQASGKVLSPNAVDAYFRAARAFWNWLVDQEEIDASPMRKLKRPKLPDLIIPTFTVDHINALLDQAKTDKRNRYRKEAIILTLLDTGVRAAELCGLRLADVDADRILVLGKGRKQRYIPIGKRAVRAIRFYLAKGRPETEATTVFVNEEGRPMTTDWLTHMVEDLGRRAHVQGVRCSPHTFRHTFALECLRSGKWTLAELQHVMGHSPKSLSVLMRYLSALSDDDVARAHAAFSPADGLPIRGKTASRKGR